MFFIFYFISLLLLITFAKSQNCQKTCINYELGKLETCDDFKESCQFLEKQYGCDCTGCNCIYEQEIHTNQVNDDDFSFDDTNSCPATCPYKTSNGTILQDCDAFTTETCKELENQGCDCSRCSCSNDPETLQYYAYMVIALAVFCCCPCFCFRSINHSNISRTSSKVSYIKNNPRNDIKGAMTHNQVSPEFTIIRRTGRNMNSGPPPQINMESNVYRKFNQEVSVCAGLVVNIYDARSHLIEYEKFRLNNKCFNDAEKDWNKKKIFKTNIQRYSINQGVPFAMISYKSTLKETTDGVRFLLNILDILISHGFIFCWWDWLVIHAEEKVIENSIEVKKFIYKQAEFEGAMFWATDEAFVVAIAWPSILDDGKDYLARPW